MNVSELIEQLKTMPQNAVVVSAKDPEDVWVVLSKPIIATKYRDVNVCIITEGYP